jgi:hypothetical protein
MPKGIFFILAALALTVTVQAQGPIGRFTRLILNSTIDVRTGAGTPEAAITAPVGSLYLRTDGGTSTTLYVKQTGAGNTGWVPAQASATRLEKETLRLARCDNATAISFFDLPTTNPAVPACDTGTNTQKATLDFADGAVVIAAQYNMALPSDWTGAIDVGLIWKTTAIAGDVVWQVATICVADAETNDPAFNAASTVTDTAKATTVQLNAAMLTGVTTTGCAASEQLYVRVFRDPAHAADTLAATARLVNMEVTYRRSQ